MEHVGEVHFLRLGIYERREIFFIPLFVVQGNILHVKVYLRFKLAFCIKLLCIIFIPQNF